MNDTPRSQPEKATKPAFPRIRATSIVSLTRELELPAWIGSQKQLERLQELVEERLEKAYEDSTDELQFSDTEDVAAAKHIARQLRLSVNVRSGDEGRLMRSGSIESTLAEMDNNEVESVLLSNRRDEGSRLPAIRIYIQKNPSASSPVTLRVVGRDKTWVAATTDILSAELRRRVPTWALMRKGVVAAALGALLAIGLLALFGASSVQQQETSGQRVAVAAVLLVSGIALGAMFLGLPLHWLLRKWFPAFEILDPGADSQARKAGAIFVGSISLLLSIVGVLLGVLAL